MENVVSTQRFIAAILGTKPIAFNPDLARLTGSVTSGLLLSQLLYWWDKKRLDKEYFYKTVKELEEETTLSKEEQLSAIKKLKACGYVTICYREIPAKRSFVLNINNIIADLSKLKGQKCKNNSEVSKLPDVVKPDMNDEKSNIPVEKFTTSITDSTTENTKENTTKIKSYRLEPSGLQPSAHGNSSNILKEINYVKEGNPYFGEEIGYASKNEKQV